MLSFGMEYDFAFSIAFCSERLPDGSPPPSFAATMIARESFEKSLPRFASAAPFLCLIEDHLLCPDICSPVPDAHRGNLPVPPDPFPWSAVADRRLRRLLNRFEEDPVHARVAGQLRMERGEHEAALADEHRRAVVPREDLRRLPHPGDPRRAAEDAAH